MLLAFCGWRRYWRCLFLLAGILWTFGYAEIGLNDRLSEPKESQIIELTGQVVGLPLRNSHRVRFDFSVRPDVAGVPAKLRLNWYSPEQAVKAGQQWTFAVKLKRPHGYFNPGGFDYERRLFSEGIGATGYVRHTPKPVLLSDEADLFDVSVWRQAIADALDQVSAETSDSGLIKALILGDRSGMTQKQWALFRQTGTVHLMAISGLHIGLIAGLVYFSVRKLWLLAGCLKISPPNVASIGALAAALAYSALAGFSVPTQRALIMLTVVILARLWRRNIGPANTLSVALLAVLLAQPLALLSVGSWLSFLAVAVIVYTMAGRLASERRWLAAIKIHWRTALALSPLLLFFFQQVSLIAPVANLVAVPVISLVVVPMALAALVLLAWAPALAKHLLALCDWILQGLTAFLAELAALPGAYLNHAQPSLLAVILAGFGLALLLAPRGIPGRWLGCVMVLPLLLVRTDRPGLGEAAVTLLDVGQGLATVVQTAHHVLVYDTGARYDSGFDMGTTVVLPFLRRQGIAQIDILIISHGDNDHSGGAAALLRSLPVARMITSVPKRFQRYEPDDCTSGRSWSWDGVRFTLLMAPEREFGAGNNHSCVLQMATEFGSVLLTGDIEARAESWLVRHAGGRLRSDVMLAPHHGSNTSSSAAFLATVKPERVLISAGYRNRFGFPRREVLQRYAARHIDWSNTADRGAISVYLRPGGAEVVSQRLVRGKFWNLKPGIAADGT